MKTIRRLVYVEVIQAVAFVSLGFLALFFFFDFVEELGNLGRVSWLIAWLKMLGTGTNTVFMNIHPAYADNSFLHLLSIATTTVDCVYIYLVWKLQRQARAVSSAPASATSPVAAVAVPSVNRA